MVEHKFIATNQIATDAEGIVVHIFIENIEEGLIMDAENPDQHRKNAADVFINHFGLRPTDFFAGDNAPLASCQEMGVAMAYVTVDAFHQMSANPQQADIVRFYSVKDLKRDGICRVSSEQVATLFNKQRAA